ncbi:hypothetical protein YC2023_007978 [Brassica napus]
MFHRDSKSDAPDLARAETRRPRTTEKGNKAEEGEERREEKQRKKGGGVDDQRLQRRRSAAGHQGEERNRIWSNTIGYIKIVIVTYRYKPSVEAPWYRGLTKGLLMLLHHEIWGSNPRKHKLCRLRRKKITRGLQYGAGRIIEHGSHRTVQSDTVRRAFSYDGRIVDRRIDCHMHYATELDSVIYSNLSSQTNEYK